MAENGYAKPVLVETQWLADVRPAGVSRRVASMTRRLSRSRVNGKAKNGSTKAKPKGLNR